MRVANALPNCGRLDSPENLGFQLGAAAPTASTAPDRHRPSSGTSPPCRTLRIQVAEQNKAAVPPNGSLSYCTGEQELANSAE